MKNPGPDLSNTYIKGTINTRNRTETQMLHLVREVVLIKR